jgi:hypothetical protein
MGEDGDGVREEEEFRFEGSVICECVLNSILIIDIFMRECSWLTGHSLIVLLVIAL